MSVDFRLNYVDVVADNYSYRCRFLCMLLPLKRWCNLIVLPYPHTDVSITLIVVLYFHFFNRI